MINSKNKGAKWERDAVRLLNEFVKNADFKKIPGSGAIGTILKDNRLVGDLVGSIPGIKNNFKVECKVGYGKGQMTIKKEWLDKIKMEADADLSIPLVFCKFDGARDGVKYFVVIDIESFSKIINTYINQIEE